MLLSLSLLIGYYLIKKIASNQAIEIENKKNVQQPAMTEVAVLGKTLFGTKCASCHYIFGDGPGLANFEERGPWADRNKLYEWIKNPEQFMKKDNYTKNLKEVYGSVMISFPDIRNEEVDAIIDYINYVSRFRSDPTVIVD